MSQHSALFNFQPPATEEEVRAAALQYVRKVSGTTKPSQKNGPVFEQAVEQIAAITRSLLESMETSTEPKTREEEAAKAKARMQVRFGPR